MSEEQMPDQGGQGTFPEAQPEPSKTKLRGCLIAAAITAVVALVICAGVGTYFAVRLTGSPEFRQATRAVGGTMTVALDAMRHPAAQALRESGCQTAMVLEPEMAARLEAVMEQAKGRADRGQSGVAWTIPLVICNAGGQGEALTCEAVAQRFNQALTEPRPAVAVHLGRQYTGQPVCTGVFGPDGQRLRDVGPQESQGFQSLHGASGSPK